MDADHFHAVFFVVSNLIGLIFQSIDQVDR